MPDQHAAPPDFSRLALWSGVFYLVIIVAGITAEFAIRMPLIVSGDASATAQNILSNTALFRAGLAGDSIMAISDIALAVLLFFLFRPVQPVLATLAMVFRLIQAAILSMNMLLHHAALSLLQTRGPGAADDASVILELQAHGYDLGLIFFGVNSLIMSVLLLRSGFAPRLLGFAVMAAGLVYLAGSYARFLAPSIHPVIEPAYLIPLVAETAFAVWLLIRGFRGWPVRAA